MIVKMCGHTNLADAIASVDAGADWLGFVFYPKSRRHLPIDEARVWLDRLPVAAKRVGVFVDESEKIVRQLLAARLIDVAQLHGAESPDLCHALAAEFGPDRVIKALRVSGPDSLDEIARFDLPVMLLDGPEPGSGRVFDWNLAAQAVARYADKNFLLAGGLTPANVADAVAKVTPWGVDTASGVESGPGIKDPEKVAAFIAAVRALGAVPDERLGLSAPPLPPAEGGSGKN